MPEDKPLPVPDVPEDPRAPGVDAEAYNRLAQRIDELESQLTDRLLTAEDKERDLRLSEISQRMAIRRWTARLAAFVILLMCGLIAWTKCSAGAIWLMVVPKAYPIVLIAAPVISITTITVALLLGAFRRFKDDDPERLASSTPVSAAINGISGQQ